MALGIGGYPPSFVFCNGTPTTVVDVISPATGKTWMDRNLGAIQIATSFSDVNAYGDLYQWGRTADGHQCRNSASTSTLSSTDQPVNGDFIFSPNSPYDWRNPQNTNLWQGVNGINNPCPNGYRLPTEIELNDERLTFSPSNFNGAFSSPLKLTAAGGRSALTGLIGDEGAFGFYWTSTISFSNSRILNINTSNTSMTINYRAGGSSVRCINN